MQTQAKLLKVFVDETSKIKDNKGCPVNSSTEYFPINPIDRDAEAKMVTKKIGEAWESSIRGFVEYEFDSPMGKQTTEIHYEQDTHGKYAVTVEMGGVVSCKGTFFAPNKEMALENIAAMLAV